MEPVSIKETNCIVERFIFIDKIGIHCKSSGKSADLLRE